MRNTPLFLLNLRFFLLGHALNPLWLPRDKRRNIRCIHSYRRVKSYLDRYRPFVESLEIVETEFDPQAETEKIFSIWFQGEQNAPELVKICFERLRTLYGDRFVVLDKDTLGNWIKLPEHIMRKWREGKISHAHFSDICRVELLYTHGGMWFDATDYLTEPVPKWIEEADLFIYTSGNVITPGEFIQSCFMRARKGHPLYGAWRKFIFKYWEKEDKLVDYFLLHYMLRYLVEHHPQAHEIFYAMPQIPQDPTHLLWHRNHRTPYTDELYRELTKDTFFQKTNFKSKSATAPERGSVADYIINRKITIPYGETRLPDTCP